MAGSGNRLSLDAIVADIATAHSPNTLALTTAARILEDKLRVNSKIRCRGEFAALESLQKKKYNVEYDTSVAQAATDLELNRYVDVLPYEHTRVKLNTYIHSVSSSSTTIKSTTTSSMSPMLTRKSNGNSTTTATTKMSPQMKEQLSKYINASMVTCSDPVIPGSNWKYIAAQGPLPTTSHAFWEMILQEKVKSIVMLTDIVENKRQKCHLYFPMTANSALEITPWLRIVTKSVAQLMPGLVLRNLEIIKDGVEQYVCDHYHYTGWPDHGVPQSPTPLFLLSYMLRTAAGGEGEESPILVHCSAGIGRSGVFCVVDTAARRLVGAAAATDSGIAVAPPASVAAANAVNVGAIVSELRQQRAGMVQTTEQFVFCHTALLELTRAAVSKISRAST